MHFIYFECHFTSLALEINQSLGVLIVFGACIYLSIYNVARKNLVSACVEHILNPIFYSFYLIFSVS